MGWSGVGEDRDSGGSGAREELVVREEEGIEMIGS